MKIEEIRRYNLRRYIKKNDLEQKQLAAMLDKSPAQIGAIIGKNPRRNIGTKMARDVESTLQKPPGWLDVLHVDESDGASPDYITINSLNIRGAKGFNASSAQLEPIKSLQVSEAWLSANIDASPQGLQIAEAKGIGMEPTIKHGDLLLVDVTISRFSQDGIYVLKFENDQNLMLRRLYRDQNGVMVAANNLNLSIKDTSLESSGLKVCGKVCGIFNFSRV